MIDQEHDLSWDLAPSGEDPEEIWLYSVDEEEGVVLALLDPWCDAPGGPELSPLGTWRLATYSIADSNEMVDSAAAQAEDEGAEVPPVLLMVMKSVINEEPLSLHPIPPGEALELVGPGWVDWVVQRTEESLRQVWDLVLGHASTGAIVSSSDLQQASEHLARLTELLAAWEECGGRLMYLSKLVGAVDERRADLLDVMEEQPTTTLDWAALLQHRLIEHVVESTATRGQMTHRLANELAWTAAMASEAAFMHDDGTATLEEMRQTATARLSDALNHGHHSPTEWLSCASHRAAEIALHADDRPRALKTLHDIYAHLTGAIEHAGCGACVSEPDHDHE